MARSSAARRSSASRAPASSKSPARGPRATSPARKKAESAKTLKPAAKKTATKKSAAKKSTAKKAAKKKAVAKKSTTKKAPAKKATAKKTAAKKTPARKATAKKAVASKAAAAKKTTAKKTVTKAAAKPATTRKRVRLAAQPTTSRTTPAKATTTNARLSEAELTGIWKTYKRTRDDNLRNILIEHHMPLVKMIAERLLQTLPKSIELDDLTSAGTFGLMDAINGFDLTRGIKFKTYCTTRIRGSILDELRSQDWVPRLVRLKAHRLEKSLRKLEGELGRNPNAWELAEAMELTIPELLATQQEASAKAIFSLSEKWDDGDDDKALEKVEILADKKQRDPFSTVQQRDVLDTITRNLTKKERLIIIMYYYEGLTMREIGEIMELTESRVCQIHSNVMSRLKSQLEQNQLTVA